MEKHVQQMFFSCLSGEDLCCRTVYARRSDPFTNLQYVLFCSYIFDDMRTEYTVIENIFVQCTFEEP